MQRFSNLSTGFFLPGLLFLLVLGACATPGGEPGSKEEVRDGSNETSTEAVQGERSEQKREIRNIILVIGDGMGPQQVGLLNDYARRAPNSIYNGEPSALERLAQAGSLGLAATHSHSSLTVDSACSATHLATGQYAPLESLGADIDGEVAKTVLEIARDRGMSTGLVSDTRITHATPAAFASHVAHRSMENQIAEEMLATRVDVLLSGGLRHFLPAAVNTDDALRASFADRTGQVMAIASRREDERDLLDEAQALGYSLVFDRQELKDVTTGPVLGLFSLSGMGDAIEKHQELENPERREPSLLEMSEAALRILSENEEGFFLMIEAGQIDWAGHNNDAGTLLHEMIRIDRVVAMLHQWVDSRDGDTLLIVTADHETGGFGFSYSGAEIPEPVELHGSVFEDHPHWPQFNFGSLDILDGLYAQRLSFTEIFRRFDSAEQQTPELLVNLVNEHSVFSLTLEEATRILTRSENRIFHGEHPYLSLETLPHVDDFHAFYVYGDEIRANLLGRALATEQNVVWSTGTHTHTPVPVILYGDERLGAQINRFLHLQDVGRLMIETIKVRD